MSSTPAPAIITDNVLDVIAPVNKRQKRIEELQLMRACEEIKAEEPTNKIMDIFGIPEDNREYRPTIQAAI